MPTRNRANRLPARYGLGDDPRLLLGAPCPPPASPREDLDAPGILSVSTMLSDHSKPNGETDTEDSQNSSPRERWGQNSAYSAEAHDDLRIAPRHTQLTPEACGYNCGAAGVLPKKNNAINAVRRTAPPPGSRQLGRDVRILMIVDDCTRRSLALVADISISGTSGSRMSFDRLLVELSSARAIVS